MSALADELRRRIVQSGPLTVADYMALCLAHPQYGYYRQHDPLGVVGDFVTAPEISQVFGELLYLWLIDCWQAQGEPSPFQLVELGPGRGTLSADGLRVAGKVPAFLDAAQLHLVEINSTLREYQQSKLAAYHPQWHDDFALVPDGPLFLIANEFFDVLPIHQFLQAPDGWHERLVTVAADGRFTFTCGPAIAPCDQRLDLAPPEAPIGAFSESRPAGSALAEAIARRLRRHGGAALIIDYGYAGPAMGDTLQAQRHHRPHDVLEGPGDADLTAHVDFAALAAAARRTGAQVFGPIAQGRFLVELGISMRQARLMTKATAAQAAAIAAAVHRLIAPEEMGRLFKVLALTAPAVRVPAGFYRVG